MSAIWPNSNYGTFGMSPSATQGHPYPQGQYLQLCEHISLPPWANHQPGLSLLLQDTVEDNRGLRVQTWQCRAGVLTFGPHPQGSLRGRAMPPFPSPTHTSPGVQVVLVLLHFPAAWVAALYQAVGSEVHATNLSHQSLHLLVQDVKPDKDREKEDW